jgi:hypothetical protein
MTNELDGMESVSMTPDEIEPEIVSAVIAFGKQADAAG